MADEQPIVGRETELAELSGLAASPDGRALLLRGEAGVGKSVLLDAAAARSLALGHRVVRTAACGGGVGTAVRGAAPDPASTAPEGHAASTGSPARPSTPSSGVRRVRRPR